MMSCEASILVVVGSGAAGGWECGRLEWLWRWLKVHQIFVEFALDLHFDFLLEFVHFFLIILIYKMQIVDLLSNLLHLLDLIEFELFDILLHKGRYVIAYCLWLS